MIVQIYSIQKTKSMNNQTHKYPYLKNTSATLTAPLLDSLRPKSPISNARYLPCSSPHRQHSPNHLKVKIRLVSPQRIMNATAFVRKQNTPPVQPAQLQKHRESLKSPRKDVSHPQTNPGRCIAEMKLNQQSHLSIVHHFDKQSNSTSPMHSLFRTTLIHDASPNRQLDQAAHPFSPQRAEPTNTSFDLANIKSIVYANPMSQKRGSWNKVNKIQVQRRVHTEQSAFYDYCPPSDIVNNLHSDLFIQEQNNLEKFKLTYQQQIKTQSDNTAKLSGGKISSKREIGGQQIQMKKAPVCSQQTIINELNINTANKIENRQNQSENINGDSISENTERETYHLDSKIHRLKLIRNQQCSIQMVMSARPALPQNEQTVIIPSVKQSKDVSENNSQKELNACSHSLLQSPSTKQKKVDEVEPVLEYPTFQTPHSINIPVPALNQSIHKLQKSEPSSLQSIPSEKNESQKSISVKSRESKAGSIVSQKIEPKEQKKQIIAQEVVAESIVNREIAQTHLAKSKNPPAMNANNQTIAVNCAPSPKAKTSTGRQQWLCGQPAATVARKFNNRAYL